LETYKNTFPTPETFLHKMNALFFNSFSSILLEVLLGVYILAHISYTILLSCTQKYGYQVLISSSVSFAQILLAVLISGFSIFIFTGYNTFSDLLSSGSHGMFFQLAMLVVSLVSITLSRYYLSVNKIMYQHEYLTLILLSVFGMTVLCSASDILIVYLGIELQSLAFYILATFHWRSDYNVEAGLKYFILGAFSSCLLLFGFAVLYLVLGSTSFEALLNLSKESTTFDLPLFGLAFLLVAFLFKVGASPFHMWLCDVYEGAMTPVTLFFALVPKIVLFYLILKLLLLVFLSQDSFWGLAVGASAFLSILVASLGALYQKKVKRLLAFSAISHTGFILLAVCCCSIDSMKAYNFYILFYVIMNVTFFSIIMVSKTNTDFLKYLANWSFSSKRNYVVAITFSLVLFSVGGVPPFVGFYSKLLVLLAMVNESKIFLTTAIALLSCVGCFYYIRLIKIFFFCGSGKGLWVSSAARSIELPIAFCSTVVYLFLFHPDSLLFTSSMLSITFSN